MFINSQKSFIFVTKTVFDKETHKKNEVGSLPPSLLQPEPAPFIWALSKKDASGGTTQGVSCLIH